MCWPISRRQSAPLKPFGELTARRLSSSVCQFRSMWSPLWVRHVFEFVHPCGIRFRIPLTFNRSAGAETPKKGRRLKITTLEGKKKKGSELNSVHPAKENKLRFLCTLCDRVEIWIIVANVESRGYHPPREGASFVGRLDYAQGSIVRISSTPGGPISAGYATQTANPDE